MSTKVINPIEIQQKINEKLNKSGWLNFLRSFVTGSEFTDIINKLINEVLEDRRFTPPLKIAFKAFEECNIDDLKVVIVGQDPYPYFGIADGVSFSCGITMKAQPSLQNILEQVKKTVRLDNQDVEQSVDLTRWSKQGILMLNAALTCKLDTPGTHTKIWKPFTSYLIDSISSRKESVIFVFMGNVAQEFADLVDESKHYIIKTEHPAAAKYKENREWNCNDMFNKINEYLKINSKSIIW